ncbi:NmrA/HSCARG family protein [Mycobacterium sp. pW049]|uniref:NmrA/HSCARG family protein n=1 Tax=[Mycobacterium] bulgaricum TaxID=3238985 RepID=UPI00351BA549
MKTRTLAVVGATGSQGGGLVEAVRSNADSPFQVRALTRNRQSPQAQALAAGGTDVVEADLDDLDSMRRAFDGADAAFVVTDYWARRTPEDEASRTRAEMELAQAENAALAAKSAGVGHVIWSTLEDTRDHFGDDERVPTVEGRYKVPHFDAKAEADSRFVENDVPTTFLRTTMFFEGFAGAMGPMRDERGNLVLALPIADELLSTIAVADIGKTAVAIFVRGHEFIGQTVSIAGDHLTGEQYASALSEAKGEAVAYRPMSWDDFRAQDFPGAVEMGNMFQYYAENSASFVGARDLTSVRKLNPQLQSFRQWLTLHAADIRA